MLFPDRTATLQNRFLRIRSDDLHQQLERAASRHGIYFRSYEKTLPVTLTYFVGPYATNYVQMFAAIIIAIAPTVVVYSLFSNQIVEGLTTGAVKG